MRTRSFLLPCPSLLVCAVLLSLLFTGAPARAQSEPDAGGPDAGESADAGQNLPDASVGEGGAERDDPSGEDSTGRVQLDCRLSDRCAPGFQCVRGECVWTGVRDAEGPGCALGSTIAALMLGTWLFARQRD